MYFVRESNYVGRVHAECYVAYVSFHAIRSSRCLFNVDTKLVWKRGHNVSYLIFICIKNFCNHQNTNELKWDQLKITCYKNKKKRI